MFSIFVILPVVLSSLYFGLMASDQYISEGSFIIKSPGRDGGRVSTFANLIQSTALSRGQEETNAVIDYIRSRDALTDLQKRIDVRAIFMSRNADIFARYPAPLKADCFENLYDYYKNKVEVYTNPETGIAVLRVKAFSAEDAHTVATGLLFLSEDFVNRMNKRAHHQAIAEAERRVAEAEDHVKNALSVITNYRNTKNILDPGKQASSILEVITKLSNERANIQARLDRLLTAAPNNPRVKILREHIDSLTREIEQQTQLMTGADSALASKLGDYAPLLLQENFTAKMLETTSASLEAARAEADKQQFYLQRVAEPNTPDRARYPKRLSSILIVFGSVLCLYFIFWMLIAGILEHRPED